jgi:hypothetical protein
VSRRGPELGGTGPLTCTISSEQLGALRVRRWVSVTIATGPHLLYEVFDATYGEDPCAPRNSDDGLDGAAACAAELMRMHIDTIQADAALRIDAYHQSQVHGDDTRERIRRGDHEHDDHLQPRRLLYVCTIENCAHHHAWNRDDSHYADRGKAMAGG